jgi:hypothetical protein
MVLFLVVFSVGNVLIGSVILITKAVIYTMLDIDRCKN